MFSSAITNVQLNVLSRMLYFRGVFMRFIDERRASKQKWYRESGRCDRAHWAHSLHEKEQPHSVL